MDNTYAVSYRQLYENHWWWRAREQYVLATIRQCQLPGSRPHILDVGCGDGLLFDRLKQFGEAEGVEVDPSLVSANGRWRERIHVRPFDESFRPGKQYGLILMLDVLEHLADAAGALRHALDLLHDEGTLLITVPAFRALWTTHDELNHHYTRFTKSSFRALADSAGAEIIGMRYLFHWTFAAKLAVRLKESVLRTQPQPPCVPPRLVNQTLLRMTQLEQRLLSPLPVPFGTSLLAVVRGRR